MKECAECVLVSVPFVKAAYNHFQGPVCILKRASLLFPSLFVLITHITNIFFLFLCAFVAPTPLPKSKPFLISFSTYHKVNTSVHF